MFPRIMFFVPHPDDSCREKLRRWNEVRNLAIHAGQEPDPKNGAVMTPVYFTSTYMQDGLESRVRAMNIRAQ